LEKDVRRTDRTFFSGLQSRGRKGLRKYWLPERLTSDGAVIPEKGD